MYELYIANKNYSSWSLRPWLLMRELNIAFREHLLAFGDAPDWQTYRSICPSGKVPCLRDEGMTVWESLAIAEYLAERHEGIWPRGREARAWARSAAAQMHAGFTELRERCSMSCGLRIRLSEHPAALEHELAQLAALWGEGLGRFGGPFLAGERFSAADAFYAPVAFRLQTYGLSLDEAANAYARRLLALPAMQAWYAAALAEPLRDAAHEADTLRYGSVLRDLRQALPAAAAP